MTGAARWPASIGHPFEGWFGSSVDFDDQAARRLLQCPVCDTHAVAKADHGLCRRRDEAPRPGSDAAGLTRAMMMEAIGDPPPLVEDTFDRCRRQLGGAGPMPATSTRASPERSAASTARLFARGRGRALVEDGVPVAPMPPEPPKKTEVN